MKQLLIRRACALAFLFAAAGTPVAAQGPVKTAEIAKRGLTAQDFPKVIPLVPNVYAYEDVHVAGAITTNSLIVVTPQGVVVVDGQGTVPQTERMLAEIRKLSNQPIRYVIIGSIHADHTGGNSAFPETATFIAHPTAQAALQRAASQPPRPGGPANPPKIVVPTETVADKSVLNVGGTEIQILNLGRSHTGSDLTVYLPAQNVLFLSETYMPNMFPSMATGFPTEWIAAVKKAEAMDATWYVPSHGFVDDAKTLKDELPVFRRALETVVAEGKRLHDMAVPVDQAAMQANFGEFNSWSIREMFGPSAIRRVYAELNGEVK
jgi:glyoxylase-like metal-dependent hydrolase (beta-lactamase superfamily II)